jgi:Fe(3+) dicitrate transport protein
MAGARGNERQKRAMSKRYCDTFAKFNLQQIDLCSKSGFSLLRLNRIEPMKPLDSSPHQPVLARLARPIAVALAAGAIAFSHRSASAQEAAAAAPAVASAAVDLAPITVVGDAVNIPQIAGSAAVIDEQQIQRQTYTNPNRVLQQVPGVYVREEDGFGNFPNISLRGADGGRSSKLTIMEDGIMMAPAPYSDPSAYYSPRIGRMSSIEILKGSSQVRYGPQTTGGVINYLSTPFVELPAPMAPEPAPADAKNPGGKSGKSPVTPTAEEGPDSASEGFLKSTYGSFNTFYNHAWWGHTQKMDAGTLGVLLEFFHNQSDGYREIDKVGGDTGFTTIEPMVRLFFEPDSLLKQRFEFRFGYTAFEADETYLGLRDSDLRADPFRRYVASQFDNITSDQFRYSLSHIMQPTDNLRIETTAYYTSFARDWYKLDNVRDVDGNDIGLAEALGTAGLGYDIVRGSAAGSWKVRSNNREYSTMGIQTRADWSFETGSLEHDLSLGARLHYDESSRFQRDDRVSVNNSGSVLGISRGRQGEAGNREANVLAYSMYIEDSIKLGRLTVKPGVRWEHLELEYTDRAESGNLNRVTGSGSGSLDALAPGVGLVYELTDTWSVFGGYYRGISTPGPREFLRDGTDIEQSNGYELGVRHYGPAVQTELVGFFTDFDSLIVRDNLGGAGGADDANAGSAEVAGLEFAVRWDALASTDSDWRLPLRASATYTHSEITSASPSGDAESIFSGGTPGSQLPYIPEFTASAGLGLEYRGFGLYLDGTYTSDMYGTARNTSTQRDFSGTPDARYGKTDDAVILDLSLQYQIRENIRLIAGISNLTGEEYIVSRLPYGARSNQPRSYYGGVEIRF